MKRRETLSSLAGIGKSGQFRINQSRINQILESSDDGASKLARFLLLELATMESLPLGYLVKVGLSDEQIANLLRDISMSFIGCEEVIRICKSESRSDLKSCLESSKKFRASLPKGDLSSAFIYCSHFAFTGSKLNELRKLHQELEINIKLVLDLKIRRARSENEFKNQLAIRINTLVKKYAGRPIYPFLIAVMATPTINAGDFGNKEIEVLFQRKKKKRTQKSYSYKSHFRLQK